MDTVLIVLQHRKQHEVITDIENNSFIILVYTSCQGF